MSTDTLTYGALCTDFYVNQKLELKMDLPPRRESVLDMFGRVRKQIPAMENMRRYQGEMALESTEVQGQYSWLGLQQTSIRSGWVNPDDLSVAYRLHQLVLDAAPYYLSISPLDIEHIELIFGFDLACRGNRDAVVYEALLAGSPLEAFVNDDADTIIDLQPAIGISIQEHPDMQAFLEVKTRGRPIDAIPRVEDEPISVYLTTRHKGPLQSLDELSTVFATLAGYLERLAEDRVVPGVLMPLHSVIVSR
jgi:hypothetical protein